MQYPAPHVCREAATSLDFLRLFPSFLLLVCQNKKCRMFLALSSHLLEVWIKVAPSPPPLKAVKILFLANSSYICHVLARWKLLY